MARILEKIILRKIEILLHKNKFFEGKNTYAYQKYKNAPQALFIMIEEMSKCITQGNIGAAVITDLEGAFNNVWRKGAIYKLHQAGIKGNLLKIINSYFIDRKTRSLVNKHVTEWAETDIGLIQGGVLSPIIFLVYTADLTANEQQKIEEYKSQESKFADDVNIWRISTNCYDLQIKMQLAIMNLEEWCCTWRMRINTTKTKLLLIYDPKKVNVPQFELSIQGIKIEQVKEKVILGIKVDDKLRFDQHIEMIETNTRKSFSRLLAYPKLHPKYCINIYKAFIRSKIEYGNIIWGHAIRSRSNLKKLEDTQRAALSIILRPMKTSPKDTLEVETCVEPIDLRLEKLQRIEALKITQKNEEIANMILNENRNKMTPAKNNK